MDSSTKGLIIRTIFVLFVTAIGIYFTYPMLKGQEKLPIYNPSDISPKLVNYNMRKIRKYHKIPTFNLINQNREIITEKTFENKIYVADFFFATCPTICKKMAKHFKYLQDHFEKDNEILFLSHTVYPENDSIPVLKAYAKKNGAIDNKWHLVTGDKKHIYELARKAYFAVVDSGGNGGEYDFIHTENFILIDKKKRIRGFYDGTNRREVKKLIQDIKILKRED